MKISLLGCCILFALATGAQAQQPNDENKSSRISLISSFSKLKTALDSEKRARALARINGYSERVDDFKDIKAKTRTLARLAVLLWDHDKGGAQRLFLRAFNSVQLAEPAKGKESGRGAQAGLPPREWLHLKWEVLGAMSKKDSALAKRLIDEMSDLNELAFSADERSAMLINLGDWVARDHPEQAVEFMKQGLTAGKINGIGVVFTLGSIREKNPADANALFLQAVNRMMASPNVDAIELLNLGAYLFTSRGQDPSNYSEIFNVVIGGVMTPVVNVERLNLPPSLIQAYLNASVTILSRQLADPRQKKIYYIAAYQLMPQVQRYIPARAAELALAMTALMPDLPPALAQDSGFADLQTTPTLSFEESQALLNEEKTRGTVNEQAHDTRCLLLVCDLYGQHNFAGARVLVSKTYDPDLRSQLTNLIDFGEASKLLEQKRVDEAEEKANNLESGIERAILWLGIARMRLDANTKAQAAESLVAAVKEARRVEDSRQPYLLLCAASEYARFDSVMAMVTLQEAVKSFNKQEDETWERVAFQKEVATQKDARTFPLSINGIEPRFSTTLARFADGKLEEAESILMNLEDPALLGAVFVAVSAALLK